MVWQLEPSRSKTPPAVHAFFHFDTDDERIFEAIGNRYLRNLHGYRRTYGIVPLPSRVILCVIVPEIYMRIVENRLCLLDRSFHKPEPSLREALGPYRETTSQWVYWPWPWMQACSTPIFERLKWFVLVTIVNSGFLDSSEVHYFLSI